ncbi:MAG TPA: FecR domain-containing protein [Ramlibacter sp.]|nr:FecR domain-containing protein [Ramlibacter sp.]
MSVRRSLLALAAVVCCSAHGHQHEHQVAPGDTLISIAERYWSDPRYWRVIRQANPAIRNERHLQPGSVVRVPMPAAGSGAVAIHVSGKVTLTRFGRMQDLASDAEIRDTDVLDVSPGAYVTLRWADGVITHLLPGTKLRVVPPPPDANGSRARTLELQGGSVDSTVPRRLAPGSYQIRTRVGAAAVRGTEFGVRLLDAGTMITDVTAGEVVLAGEGYRPVGIPAGKGARADRSGRQPTATTMLPPPALDDPLVLTPGSEVRGSAVAGAQGYEFELATDAEPPATLLRAPVAAPAMALPPLTDGTYRLALRAVDAQGIPGQPVERKLAVISLPSPFLSEPANDSVLAQDLPARLTCSEVPNATGYQVEIRRVDAPEELRRLEAGGSCAVSLPALPIGRYEWRAFATRTIAPGRLLRSVPSAPARFAIAARPPAPSLKVSGGQSLRLMWEGVPDATYVVQLARDLEFRSLVRETRAEAPEVTLQVPTGEAYYVRIRTVSASGMASDFSQPRILRGPHSLATGDGEPVRDSTGTPLAPQR